jgi:uncharacterized membrane protein YhaH (DUF805 family)
MKWVSFLFANYATFSGRVSRSLYWRMQLRLSLIPFIIFISLFNVVGSGSSVWMATLMIGWLLAILILLPSVALTVRRLHDGGHSGMWLVFTFSASMFGRIVNWERFENFGSLIMFIQSMAALYILIMICEQGDSGPNEYGDVPVDTM